MKPLGDCWLWGGPRSNKGYGVLCGPGIRRQGLPAHRVVYEALVGPIPEGLQLDHLCMSTGCVNPDHLEPVTGRVNVLRGRGRAAQNARKTVCAKGHPFDYFPADGSRQCKRCRNAANQRNKRRQAVPSAPQGEQEELL